MRRSRSALRMAVTYPRAGNLGGGGFMVIHRARRRGHHDRLSRDRAAGDQRQERFSTRRATPTRKNRAIRRSPSACPGTVAGLALALEKYGSGKFTLADLIAPAIALARDGIEVADDTADIVADRARPARALAATAQDLPESPTARCSRRATAWSRPNSPRRSKRSPQDGPRAFYEGADRGKDRRRGAGGRRRHDRRRSQSLSRRSNASRCAAPIAATTSSRCRRRRRAASR